MYQEKIKPFCDALNASVGSVIFGKDSRIKLVTTALICSGHVLLDDIPGTGKTSLAKALAKSLDCSFRRIQFTPDLLPSDVTGINFFNQKEQEFRFREGPIFTDILLADEINRTTPRTQSALLEAMEERQATVDGVSYPLSDSFFVIATQNPVESAGVFPLPQAQIDRFLMRLTLGYPEKAEDKRILDEYRTQSPLDEIKPVVTKSELAEVRAAVRQITVSDSIKNYIVSLANATRSAESVRIGVSPRGSLMLMRAAQAYAGSSGRDYVIPDDIKEVARAVWAHRIVPRSQNTIRMADSGVNIIDYILDSTPAPIE